MKKVFVSYPVDYVAGHLRYGHKEGEITFKTNEDYEAFKADPEKFLRDYGDLDLDLIVDDWEVDDYDGDIHDVEFKELN